MLLERSQPRPSGIRLWQAAGVFALIVMLSTYLSTRGAQSAQWVSYISGLVMLGLVVGLFIFSWRLFRLSRAEHMQLEAAEELIRLRRWQEAGILLNELLSRPTRTLMGRVQGLIFLCGVLARYNRFDDAVAVQNHLLENYPLDEGTTHGLRLGRAMAMLRQDHLFDADRAINELRTQVNRAGRAMIEANPEKQAESPQSLSAGLALIEIYRDVKTGHPAEAIETFNTALPAMRDQLGHRVADAYALVARAYDLLGRETEAQAHFENATILAPVDELNRRYPEVEILGQKYKPADVPKEAA